MGALGDPELDNGLVGPRKVCVRLRQRGVADVSVRHDGDVLVGNVRGD